MRITAVILFLFFSFLGSAQQETQYTQFAYTGLNYNPAVAGLEDKLSVTGRIRNQWSGIDGAPQAQSLLIEFPTIFNSVGIGVIANRSTIGIQERNDLAAMYAYKVRLQEATISFGLQVSFRQFVNDFSKPGLIAIDGIDPDSSLSRNRFSSNIFNLGIGAFLDSKRYYLGFAIPRYLRPNIDINKDDKGSKEVRHIYGMFGLKFNLSSNWKTQPQFLLTLVEQAPFDLDIQNNFIYQDQVHLGFNVRAGGTQESLFESFALLIGFKFTEEIFASLSYDFNTTTLRQFEEGSFEVLLSYKIGKDRTPNNIQNPRYF